MDALNIVIGALPYQLYFRYKSFNLNLACNLKSIDSTALDTCCVSLLKSSSDSGTITLTKTQDLRYMYTAPLSTLSTTEYLSASGTLRSVSGAIPELRTNDD